MFIKYTWDKYTRIVAIHIGNADLRVSHIVPHVVSKLKYNPCPVGGQTRFITRIVVSAPFV